ncbi:MAG TPA: rhomboid family intramembrane serine protease [Desulfurococcales archaeon]|nr:rhomboid family intramembrane serine protease [Desulfurococcales archaeon]
MIPIGDINPVRRFPYVNTAIIIVNTIIFFTLWIQGVKSLEQVIMFYGAIPYYILTGKKLWTLVTSMFLHAGPIHLIGNMIYLYIFGDNIEDYMGSKRYLLFYILAGLGAHLFHLLSVLIIPANIRYYSYMYWGYDPLLIPAVGASGAISGVLGAYILLYPKAKVKVISLFWFLPVVILVPAWYFIGLWFLYQLVLGFWTLTGIPTGVAYWAHIGGFLTGMALTPILGRRRDEYRLVTLLGGDYSLEWEY